MTVKYYKPISDKAFFNTIVRVNYYCYGDIARVCLYNELNNEWYPISEEFAKTELYKYIETSESEVFAELL